MTHETVVIGREDLYQQVWSLPVGTLAKTYGISGVGLAKICAKLNVPVPGRGYWARRAAGGDPPRLPLPPLESGHPEVHVLDHRRPTDSRRTGPVAPTQDQTGRKITPVVVTPTLESPHALVKLSVPILKRLSGNRNAVAQRPRERCLDVAVAPASLDRALRIMDALLKALEANGYKPEILVEEPSREGRSHPPKEPATCVTIDGERVEFGIEERFRQDAAFAARQAVREPGTVRITYPRSARHGMEPTGELSLRIRNATHEGRQQAWRDTRTHRVEGCIASFIEGLITMAASKREERIDRERHEAEQRAEARRQETEQRAKARRQEAEERRRHEESARIRDLHERTRTWASAKKIREFVAAVEARATKRQRADPALREWLLWARSHADQLAEEALRIDPKIPRR